MPHITKNINWLTVQYHHTCARVHKYNTHCLISRLQHMLTLNWVILHKAIIASTKLVHVILAEITIAKVNSSNFSELLQYFTILLCPHLHILYVLPMAISQAHQFLLQLLHSAPHDNASVTHNKTTLLIAEHVMIFNLVFTPHLIRTTLINLTILKKVLQIIECQLSIHAAE